MDNKTFKANKLSTFHKVLGFVQFALYLSVKVGYILVGTFALRTVEFHFVRVLFFIALARVGDFF